MFLADPETQSINHEIGEIGGSAEEEAAQFLADEEKSAAAGSQRLVSSPAARRLRAAGWAMQAPSSPAARAAPEDKIEAIEGGRYRGGRQPPATLGEAVLKAIG